MGTMHQADIFFHAMIWILSSQGPPPLSRDVWYTGKMTEICQFLIRMLLLFIIMIITVI